MTREINHEAAEDIELDAGSLDVAAQAGAAAYSAGLEPGEELEKAIRAYIQAERERIGVALLELEPMAAVAETWIRRKYVQHADERQKGMGLDYTTAETKDLARAFARFCQSHAHKAAEIMGKVP